MSNRKINIEEEVRRVTNELSAQAAGKALQVSNEASAKAAEVADLAKSKAAEVSTLAIAKALDVATLAAQKAADAAIAAAAIASATSGDLARIKEDVKEIKDRLDNKYVSKEEFSTVRAITYGLVALIMVAVVGALMTLVLRTSYTPQTQTQQLVPLTSTVKVGA